MVLLSASAASAAKPVAPKNLGLRGKNTVQADADAGEEFGPSLSDVCLDGITGVADTLVSPIELAIQSFDPIEIMDEKTFELLDYDLPLGCTANANLTADLGSVTGLNTADISITLVDGTCDINPWRQNGNFLATWRLSKTVTTLSAEVSARLESAACGQSLDAEATGSATIPEAAFSVDILLGGSVSLRGGISAGITTANLTDVSFDISSVDLGFVAESPLADYNVDFSIKDYVTEEFKDRVSELIISYANDVTSNLLPFSYPPPDN